jgi:23S rRNA (uracil1939-C5)-methyltransferase
MSYEEQLREKYRALQELFAPLGMSSLPPIIPSPMSRNYRHKVQLPFGTKKMGKQTRVVVGCYARDSHAIVDQHLCAVQDGDLTAIAHAARDWANAQGVSAYSEAKRLGFLRHILLRKGAGTGEILIGLVTNGQRPIGSRRLAATLLEAAHRSVPAAKIVGIVQNVNMRQTNVVLGDRELTWWGRPFLVEKLGPYTFKVGISTFFQVNPYQMPSLYNEVLRWIENGPAVLDCYCGIGSISLWVSKKSRYVTGIEESAASIGAAKGAAAANGVRNVRFICGAVEAVLPEVPPGEFETVVLDPPRRGLADGVIEALLRGQFRRIIYVSCNPASLARDIAKLQPAWRPVSLQGVDMFPNTEHIEAVAVLDRRQPPP